MSRFKKNWLYGNRKFERPFPAKRGFLFKDSA